MGLAARCSEAIRGHAAAELSSMVTVFCLQDCIYAPIMAGHGRASWQAMGDD